MALDRCYIHIGNDGREFVIVNIEDDSCKGCNERQSEYCWNTDCSNLPKGLYIPGKEKFEMIDKLKLQKWFHEVYSLYGGIMKDDSAPAEIREGALIRLEMAYVIGMEIKSGRFDV